MTQDSMVSVPLYFRFIYIILFVSTITFFFYSVRNCDRGCFFKCFYLEIYQNNIYSFKKNIIFDISTSKRSKIIKKLIELKNKNFKNAF